MPEQRERVRAYSPLDRVKITQQELKRERKLSWGEKKEAEFLERIKQIKTEEPVTHIDVTDEYYKTAPPGSHVVQDLTTYEVDGVKYTVDGHDVQLSYSAHEKEIAELLEKDLGGELLMVPKVNKPEGISTPDYLFRGLRFDLKSPEGSGKNTLYDSIAKKSRQAENFVLDLTKCPLSDEDVTRQIGSIYRSKHTRFVDVMVIVKNGKIINIFRRNKQ